MNILQSIILGIVQGFTEFLPVSSSGHLLLLEKLFGINEGNLFFTLALHIGTLIAVIAVFHKEIWFCLRHPFDDMSKGVIVATLVTGVIYILVGDYIESTYDGRFLAFGFLFTALLLYLASNFQNVKKSKNITLLNSAFIGFMQGLALFPGVSRSGSTISGGLLTGVDKDKIAKFSFILSIPPILIGTVKEATDLRLISIPWVPVIIGITVSALSGYIAIRFMLKIIKKQKLSYFSVYLTLLATVILLDQYIFHKVF